MDLLELRHGELVWDPVRFDVETLTDICLESFHLETVSIEESAAVGSLVKQSTFPDSVPELGTFFGRGLLRLLTDSNRVAFLVFAIGVSDHGP